MSTRLVLDTNILVSALRSKHGASRQLLHLLADNGFDALVTVPLVLEYESVLKRAEHLQATGLLRADLVDRFLGDFLRHSEPVRVSYRWRPQLSDPADELVLEAAVNGRADWIVTHNLRDFAGVAKRFKVGVCGPAPILQKLLEEMNDEQIEFRP
jgi:putative PIN family toxin of toxin-antitoxin system